MVYCELARVPGYFMPEYAPLNSSCFLACRFTDPFERYLISCGCDGCSLRLEGVALFVVLIALGWFLGGFFKKKKEKEK